MSPQPKKDKPSKPVKQTVHTLGVRGSRRLALKRKGRKRGELITGLRGVVAIPEYRARVSAKEIKDMAAASLGLDADGLALQVAGKVREDSYTFSPHNINNVHLIEVSI